MSAVPADVASVAGGLKRLGLVSGDCVMVHASLRAVGPVPGGGDGVLDALASVVGTSGTVLMYIGARDDWSWVNERPEADRAILLAGAEPFDPQVTAADPDIGILAELLRRRAGTVVTDNPEGRFGAFGARAAELLADQPWDDYYGPGSPLARLVEARGKVLRLGADLDTVTLLHYAEYLVALPEKRRARRHRRVAGPDGPVLRVVNSLDDTDGIVEHPGEDYFLSITRSYLASGRACTGTVGNAHSELIDAADLVDFAVGWMAEHLSPRTPS